MLTMVMTAVLAMDGGVASAVAKAPWSDSLAPLVKAASARRVVVIGEVHEMAEPHQLVRELLPPLADAGFTHLALEGQEDRQVVIDQFLAGSLDAAGLEGSLLSSGLRGLVVQARQLGLRVLLIDGPSSWNVDTLEQTRDQRMFRHLRRVLDDQPRAKVLAVVGNSHVVKNVQLEVLAEGAGHVLDAHRLAAYRLGHFVTLYTKGEALLVRTVDPSDGLGRALAEPLTRRSRLSSPVAGTSLAELPDSLNPNGSLNVGIRRERLGVLVDWVVAFRALTPEAPAR